MWTDARLDDLNAKVDRGFEQVDKRFEQVDKRLERIEDRLDGLYRAQILVLVTLASGMFTGFCGLLAAQIWA